MPDVPHEEPTAAERAAGTWRRCPDCERDWATRHFTNRGRCVNCSRAWARHLSAISRAKQKANGTYRRPTLQKYGLTESDFQEMVTKQEGRCPICLVTLTFPIKARQRGVRATDACIDHDHLTNAIRDILCSRCNRLLGAVSDDSTILGQAAAYLKRHRDRPGRFTKPVPRKRGMYLITSIPVSERAAYFAPKS